MVTEYTSAPTLRIGHQVEMLGSILTAVPPPVVSHVFFVRCKVVRSLSVFDGFGVCEDGEGRVRCRWL